MTHTSDDPRPLAAAQGSEGNQHGSTDGSNGSSTAGKGQYPSTQDGDSPRPDDAAAVAFLARMALPPWHLVAFDPKKDKAGPCGWACCETQEDARAFIAKHNGRNNLYWHVNPLLRTPKKGKSEIADVAAMAVLHVDIDPRHGETVEACKARALKAIGGFPLRPTAIISSGSGVQAFWRLRDPVPVDGDEAAAEACKSRTARVANALGGDTVSNVDRVMRVPHTANIPNAKKRAKGRVPSVGYVIEFGGAEYGAEEFPPLETAVTAGAQAKANIDIGAVHRLADVGELDQWQVPPRVKAVIVRGHDPDAPKKDNSRSAWLFDVVCQLVRCGVPDQMVFAVITDPGFAISASVLDKGRNIERYALKQIENAKQHVAADNGDPVAFVNQRYFAALEGGKVRYYREDADRLALAMMQKDAFIFELAPLKALRRAEDGSAKSMPMSKLWMESPCRRYYRRGFVLDPTGGNSEDEYNLWRGFGLDPQAGDWSRMQEHIAGVLAGGNAEHADYITRWAAWAVQNPATPPRVALVFRGDEGIGKGAFANALVQIFGEHGLRVQNMEHLTGKFNAHLRHCCMLFADEAVAPGDADAVGALKGLITEPTVPVEFKGVDVVNADNHLHIIMASNAGWVVPAGANARRFAMFDVPDNKLGDKAYFAALFEELKNGGKAAMLHDLLAMDLKGWHPDTHRPETQALVSQKIRSLQGIDREWFNILLTGALPIHEVIATAPGFVRIVTNELMEYIQLRLRGARVTANDIAGLLGKEGMKFQREENLRPRGFILPSLAEARRRWDEHRFAVEWAPLTAEGENITDAAVHHGWHNVAVKPPF